MKQLSFPYVSIFFSITVIVINLLWMCFVRDPRLTNYFQLYLAAERKTQLSTGLTKSRIWKYCLIKKFAFVNHVEKVIGKPFNIYRFLYRYWKRFISTQFLITVFISLVRSKLKYYFCVWSAMYEFHINHLEAV